MLLSAQKPLEVPSAAPWMLNPPGFAMGPGPPLQAEPRFPPQLSPLLLTFCSVPDELPPPLPLGMTPLLSPLHLKHTQTQFRDS